MKIGLLGYGKMGKEIEKIALKRGHFISFAVNSEFPIEKAPLYEADVCIDFSTPTTVMHHIETTLKAHLPLVVGTTGWNEELPRVTEWVNKYKVGLVHASNFSIGVNLFFKLNEYLADLMKDYSDYKIHVEETHHTQKKDYPSGTAISLVHDIIQHHPLYKSWKAELNDEPRLMNETILPIRSNRIEDVPGTHEITYKSPIDSIIIEHKANNRQGFALGAVVAAEWVVNQKGIHTFREVLKL